MQTPEKGALLGHREQTDRRRDMDIPAFFDQHWSPHSHFHTRRGQVKKKSFQGEVCNLKQNHKNYDFELMLWVDALLGWL